jgi:tRNA splicing endonuclease
MIGVAVCVVRCLSVHHIIATVTSTSSCISITVRYRRSHYQVLVFYLRHDRGAAIIDCTAVFKLVHTVHCTLLLAAYLLRSVRATPYKVFQSRKPQVNYIEV